MHNISPVAKTETNLSKGIVKIKITDPNSILFPDKCCVTGGPVTRFYTVQNMRFTFSVIFFTLYKGMSLTVPVSNKGFLIMRTLHILIFVAEKLIYFIPIFYGIGYTIYHSVLYKYEDLWSFWTHAAIAIAIMFIVAIGFEYIVHNKVDIIDCSSDFLVIRFSNLEYADEFSKLNTTIYNA